MLVSFIVGEPALLIKKERIILVSDLHLGIEERLREKNFYFPQASERMGEKLFDIYKKHKAKEIILLGDIKESIGYPTLSEYRDMGDFFNELGGVRLRVTKGNHDAHIDKIFDRLGINVEVSREILLKDIALMHGNSLPSEEAMEKKMLVTGHGHASANINGNYEKVWVVVKKERGTPELVIMPPFNTLILGSDLSENFAKHMPVLRTALFDLEKAEIYNLDGEILRRMGRNSNII
jgi:putative SbcD/Mre11-related phosphoesterase